MKHADLLYRWFYSLKWTLQITEKQIKGKKEKQKQKKEQK